MPKRKEFGENLQYINPATKEKSGDFVMHEQDSDTEISKEQHNSSYFGQDLALSNSDISNVDSNKLDKRRKRRQRKKNYPEKQGSSEAGFPDDGVMSQLNELDEADIVRSDKKPAVFTITKSQGIEKNLNPNGKVYLEVRGGFKAVDKLRFSETRFPMKKDALQPQNSELEVPVATQGWFRRVATISHGLLAGLALCQALTVWLLAPPHHTWQDFVAHYTHVAYPFYAISHFLLLVCVISVFDKFDICKFQWRAIREQLGCGLELLTLVLYPLALGVALMGADRDIRLGHFYNTNSTLWWEDRQEVEQDLEQWKFLILVKCLAAIIGWLLIGINPTLDMFYRRLNNLKVS